MSPSTISSSNRGFEDASCAGHYPGDRNFAVQHPLAPGEQAKWNAAEAFYAYPYPYYPMDTSGHPHSTRSTSPPAKPSSTRSITPPTPSTTPPPVLLTPAQFIYKLQQIRLENRLPGAVGRFHILGEGLPVSVSQPRQNGPFVIQHYLPDGRADVISIAHVFEFEGEGVERGVIVWCPPPRVQYFGARV
ncbi:hypothetical protein FRC06_003280 [Ceratobasidium sp. 370]|nr:hypothetical protein FRC06_003280 [Ceratobasidium sp. 370]